MTLRHFVALPLDIVGIVLIFTAESWVLIVVATLLMLAGTIVAGLTARSGRAHRLPLQH